LVHALDELDRAVGDRPPGDEGCAAALGCRPEARDQDPADAPHRPAEHVLAPQCLGLFGDDAQAGVTGDIAFHVVGIAHLDPIQAFHPHHIHQVNARVTFEGDPHQRMLCRLVVHRHIVLQGGDLPQQELTEQMMARLLPNEKGDVRFCIEVMTISALRLEQGPGRQLLAGHLSELLPGDDGTQRADLCLLGGLIYGLLAQQASSNQEWLDKLREHLQRYLDLVMKMSPRDCKRLKDQLGGVFAYLSEAQGSAR